MPLLLTLKGRSQPAIFQHIVDSVYAAHPSAIGFIAYVAAPGRHIAWSYAVGDAAKDIRRPLSPTQPVLIASNTKTYVAAAVLRLVEQGKLHIDQPVEKLLSAPTARLLAGAGYQLGSITLKQLLSHTSGMRDYVDDRYFDSVNAHPRHQWTRDEQIALAVQRGGPYAAPADSFRYADLNYLLLTEAIETVTGTPFYQAMRSLLGLKQQGLDATWFVQLERSPKGIPPMAHQYWSKYAWDAYDLNPSWDLYGGGGMAATAHDLALFYQRLFDGKIIRDARLLALMHQDVPSGTATNYCLGIRKVPMAGLTGYYHGGFWGTDVIYFPELDASIAIITLEKTERELSAVICREIVQQLRQLPKP